MELNDPNAYIRVEELSELFFFYCISCADFETHELPIDADEFFRLAKAFEAEHERRHSNSEVTK